MDIKIALDPTVVSLLTGIFGGVGATVLWEAVLKPVRERRSLAEVLSAEVSHNIQMLGAAIVTARHDRVPPDFALSTMVFTAVASRLGELPNKVIGEVVLLYRYFDQLNNLPKLYASSLSELRATALDAPHRAQIVKEIDSAVAVFYSYVDKASDRVNIAQPLLLRTAFPWWSPRRWFGERSKSLDLDQLATQVRDSEQHRKELMEQIRKRGSAK